MVVAPQEQEPRDDLRGESARGLGRGRGGQRRRRRRRLLLVLLVLLMLVVVLVLHRPGHLLQAVATDAAGLSS